MQSSAGSGTPAASAAERDASTVSILRQSGHILLEGAPAGVDLAVLRRKLLEISGVREAHDLHLWTLTSGMNSANVHITAVPDADRERLRAAVLSAFEEHASVDHATVQIEGETEPECPMPRRHA
jgi:cobalt-zinc-cadmium efflux system protein